MERSCIDCGSVIIGRTDKKFCSDLCRNNFNNRVNNGANYTVRRINAILSRNRKILSALSPEDKAKVTRQKLDKLGFNFQYYTGNYVTRAGKSYCFCYEYGYLDLGDDFFLVVKREGES